MCGLRMLGEMNSRSLSYRLIYRCVGHFMFVLGKVVALSLLRRAWPSMD